MAYRKRCAAHECIAQRIAFAMKSDARIENALSDRIRYVRGDVAQVEFAAQMGVAIATYRNYEAGRRIPDADFIARIVHAGWNANWLLTGEGPERLGEALKASSGADSQDLRVTTASVVRACEAIQTMLDLLDLQAPAELVSKAVAALAAELDQQTVAKQSVADLLRRAKHYLTTP